MTRLRDRSPTRNASGFRRLSRHVDALHPLDVRALRDAQPGDEPNRVREALTRIQADALSRLDGIAHSATLVPRLVMLDGCHADLVFACGLDRIAPPDRLGALLARAYARADRYATACAEEIEVRDGTPSFTAATSARQSEPIVFNSDQHGAHFRLAGDLAAWKVEVAALAEGQSRLLFALSLAFAGPLLDPLGHEGAAFNLVGASSCGKTTALRLAGSVLVGSGRTARINVEAATAQVNQRRDIGQALGNGLKTRLRPQARAVAPNPAAPLAAPDPVRARHDFFRGVLCLARELPIAIAIAAFDSGLSRPEAERLEKHAEAGVRSEVELLFRLYGAEAGLALAEGGAGIEIARVNWDAVEADRDPEGGGSEAAGA